MSIDAVALAEELNRSCHCISVDPLALRRCLESGPLTAGVYESIRQNQPNLFSASSVFLARAHLEHMQAVISAIETVLRSDGFHAWAFELAPAIARHDHGPRGVFLGYDFHLGQDGPQLIEINTNAGGGLLNAALARAQQACCAEVEAAVRGAHDAGGLEAGFLAMFRDEWRLQRGDAPLLRVAIVDEEPSAQYLYPEFLLFQQLFGHAGLAAVIVDPRALAYERGALWADGARVDLVYNRLTDFWLAGAACGALRAAYAAGDVVVTPNPHVYARYADKRHLAVLSDPDRLRAWGVDADLIALLAASVPRTRVVDPAEREVLWRERKQYFFKPVDGYGGKAAYRGDKLTRATWEQILARPYVAQRLVPPSQRTIAVDGREVPLKLDLRNYVYAGQVQLVAARLYQGQTTNFRTAGGGFAPVFTEAARAPTATAS
jgi:hypothetical protein